VVTVATGAGLNAEAALSHSITVRASSTDGTFVTRVFTIAVMDVDEFDVGPVTDTDPAANSVNENVPNGTPVGITAFANDADATNSTITYSLTDSAGSRFTIHPATGVVTVADGSRLNFEAATSHAITVRATSADGSFAESNFTITLRDVDEFDVGPISDVNPAADQVFENAANGTPVGITAFAVDNDGTTNAISYTLDDNAGGRFAIHPATGVITVAVGSGFNDPMYDVRVLATSADGSSTTRVFTIAVLRAGDFDGDGDLDLADVDALSAAIATLSTNTLFDTNGDGLVNFADLQHWIVNIKRTVMGDANLNFVTDGSDFNIWNANKFTVTNQWSRGDFNANGVVDGSDFNIWNANKFTSGPGGSSPAAVALPAAPVVPAARALAIDAVFAGTRAARGRKDVADAVFAGENSWR
jgi:hypothetical protein